MAKRPEKKIANRSAAKTKAPASKSKPSKAPAKPAKPIKTTKPATAIQRPTAAIQRPTFVPPPAPISIVRAPAADAIASYEHGMNALQRHDYKTASSTFQSLLTQFPSEGPLTDRARVYLELAVRELRRRPAGSGNVEERLTAATLALNNHNDDEAARLAGDVLKEDGSQDLAAYLLAVVASRRGDVAAALAHLREAIDINPECRLQARQDEEFDPLMDSDEFHILIEAPSSGAVAAQGRKSVRKTGR